MKNIIRPQLLGKINMQSDVDIQAMQPLRAVRPRPCLGQATGGADPAFCGQLADCTIDVVVQTEIISAEDDLFLLACHSASYPGLLCRMNKCRHSILSDNTDVINRQTAPLPWQRCLQP